MKKIVSTIFVFFTVSMMFAKGFTAYMLRDNGPLRVDNNNGGVVWSITVPEGTELELVSDEVVKKDLIMEKSTIKDCEFYKVKYDGKEYFALATEVGIGNQYGAIIQNAVLYTKADIKTFRNAFLEPGTLVVILGTQKAYPDVNMYKIAFFDTEERAVKERYVQKRKVVETKDDIAIVQLVNKALVASDEEFKKTLIDTAKDVFDGYNSTAKSFPSYDALSEYFTNAYNSIYGIETESEDSTDIDNFEATTDELAFEDDFENTDIDSYDNL